MRLHHLSVTAFGPFATTAEVDFDELSSAGLFLLTGATGAGKTSILDAVCFALYGQVPGDRSGAKHLRSDHAAADLAPEVVLRLSIGDRQLMFTRSPAWMRPKLRGSGETKVQAHVLVEEYRNGGWTVLANRLDDAGLLVTDLLGMSCNQFTQVAMLPQGRFQAFLRATSAERHAVLQQLFRTDRFERVEHWLLDARTRARRDSETMLGSVLETSNRLREAIGSEDAPAWWDDLASAAEIGDLSSWAGELLSSSLQEHSRAQSASGRADDEARAATSALASAEATASLQRRGEAARRDLDALEARADELCSLSDRLHAHRQAAPLAPLARSAAVARNASRTASERWRAHRDGLADLLGSEPTRDTLADRLRHAQDAHALAVAFAPRERTRRAGRERLDEIHRGLQKLEESVAELELVLADLPTRIREAATAVLEAREAAARHPLVLASVERLEVLVAAARRAELIGLELVAARTDVLAATAPAQQAREHYLDLREARITGMAGELAGQLASGCSCPVCGSAEHPAPARAEVAGVGRAEEAAARKALDDAEFEVQARQVVVATLAGELASLDEQLAGLDRAGLAADLESARDDAERLEPLAAALDVLAAQEEACRTRLATSEEDHRAALLARAELQTEAGQVRESVAAVDEEWAALLDAPGSAPDEDGDHDLATITRLRADLVAVLGAAVSSHEARTVAAAQAAELDSQVAAATTEAGFEDVAAALAALLDDAVVLDLERSLADAEVTAHAAALTLADPEVAAAMDLPAVDLDAVRERHELATARARTTASALAAATARHARVSTLTEQLDERLGAWAPLRARHRTVAELSAFVEGKGPDNPQRMRLAAFVLAERLRQVVEAANERLAAMTERRYALEHTDDRGYGEQRGGLSLRVRDDWNGVGRDPATLSGGETFVVSLALALGLADTVAHEAGGTDIDTLFIDEGFGSLDAETLEDVMDTLDSLRDGGRVVGLVSHVPELRSRITTQLEVTKGRTGSTVATAVSAG